MYISTQFSIFNIGRLCYFQFSPPPRPGRSWPWAGIPRGGELPVLQCNISKQAPQQTSSPKSLKQAPQRIENRPPYYKDVNTGSSRKVVNLHLRSNFARRRYFACWLLVISHLSRQHSLRAETVLQQSNKRENCTEWAWPWPWQCIVQECCPGFKCPIESLQYSNMPAS